MEVSKSGNDKDYATATVLMFRYFGIPQGRLKDILLRR